MTNFRSCLLKYAQNKNLSVLLYSPRKGEFFCHLARQKDTGEPFPPIIAKGTSPDRALSMALFSFLDPTLNFLNDQL